MSGPEAGSSQDTQKTTEAERQQKQDAEAVKRLKQWEKEQEGGIEDNTKNELEGLDPFPYGVIKTEKGGASLRDPTEKNSDWNKKLGVTKPDESYAIMSSETFIKISGKTGKNIEYKLVQKINPKTGKAEGRQYYLHVGSKVKVVENPAKDFSADWTTVGSRKSDVRGALDALKKADSELDEKNPEAVAALYRGLMGIEIGTKGYNATEVAKAISELGMRETLKGVFVKETGGNLAAIFLKEKRKMPELFVDGKLKPTALAEISQTLTAAVGEIEYKPGKENEMLKDTASFIGANLRLTGVPTFVNYLASIVIGAKLAVTGYIPLFNFDVGRGIRKGELKTFDLGMIELVKDISVLGGQIQAKEGLLASVSGAAKKQLIAEVAGMKGQKDKLELIGIMQRYDQVHEALQDSGLDKNTRARLSSDLDNLSAKMDESKYVSINVSEKELQGYSSKAVFEKNNAEYQSLGLTEKELKRYGVDLSSVQLSEIGKNIDNNKGAAEKSRETKIDWAERLRGFFGRVFGGDIENVAEAQKELQEKIDDIGFLRHSESLGFDWGFEREDEKLAGNIIGLEDLKSLGEALALLGNLAGGEISNSTKKRLNNVSSKDIRKVFECLEKYHGYISNRNMSGQYLAGREARSSINSIGGIEAISKDPEKLYRALLGIADPKELKKMFNILTLKANIENDTKIINALDSLAGTLDTVKDVKSLMAKAPAILSIYKEMNRIEAINLKALDQNASMHAEVNDTLTAAIKEIRTGLKSLTSKKDISAEEIKSVVAGLRVSLDTAKEATSKLLDVTEEVARQSHMDEDIANIKNEDLKELNLQLGKVPVTEEAFGSSGDRKEFVTLANSFKGKNYLNSKESFKNAVTAGFNIGGDKVKVQGYNFYSNRGHETSNLPMITPDNIEANVSSKRKEQIARSLNLLVLNVNQDKGGRNVADTFYKNIKKFAKIHVKDSELAEAIGKGEWFSAEDLKDHKNYIKNTGSKGVEGSNSLIEGKHGGKEFGGAYKLKFERQVTLKDGRTFEVNFSMLARAECYNPVFILDNVNIVKGPDALTQADIAVVERKCFPAGVPFYIDASKLGSATQRLVQQEVNTGGGSSTGEATGGW